MWEWPAEEGEEGVKFYDAELFRQHLVAEHLDAEARALLPRDPPGVKPIEKPAEAALRLRMCVMPRCRRTLPLPPRSRRSPLRCGLIQKTGWCRGRLCWSSPTTAVRAPSCRISPAAGTILM